MFGQGQYEFVRNLPAQKSQEYGKPKNLPEQGCCIVGMGQTSNTSAVHEILERSKKGFLLNVNQAGTFIVIHGTSKIFPLSSPPIFPPLVKRFERPICGSFTLAERRMVGSRFMHNGECSAVKGGCIELLIASIFNYRAYIKCLQRNLFPQIT